MRERTNEAGVARPALGELVEPALGLVDGLDPGLVLGEALLVEGRERLEPGRAARRGAVEVSLGSLLRSTSRRRHAPVVGEGDGGAEMKRGGGGDRVSPSELAARPTARTPQPGSRRRSPVGRDRRRHGRLDVACCCCRCHCLSEEGGKRRVGWGREEMRVGGVVRVGRSVKQACRPAPVRGMTRGLRGRPRRGDALHHRPIAARTTWFIEHRQRQRSMAAVSHSQESW